MRSGGKGAVGAVGLLLVCTAAVAIVESEGAVRQKASTIAVVPSSAEVREGGILRLAAEVGPGKTRIAESAHLTWSSSNPAVAAVSDSGVVTGIREGRSTIRASLGDRRGSALVVVKPGTRASPSLAANEPAGYSTITERSFSARDDGGWHYNESRLFTIERDGTAPRACCRVGRARYPAGFRGGRSPVTTWTSFSDAGYTEIYVSFWLKLSSNWQQHSSGVSKIGFVWIHDEPSVYFAAQGSGQTLRPEIRLQNVPVGRNLEPNVARVPIERGRWHHWEAQLISNSGGRANGVARLWIDGILVSRYDDVQYAAVGQARTWQYLYWSPIWGGRGDEVRSDMSMYIDHVYASGR